MSQFLGPIHHLMWDRIKLVNDRDRFVGDRVVSELGDPGAEQVVSKARAEFGFAWNDKPLEEQVGDESIHGFLQDKVDRAEISEAALVSAVSSAFGEAGVDILEKSFYRHGEEFGANLIDEAGVEIDDLEGIEEILDTYLLEGMPCDGGVSSTIDGTGTLLISRPDALHKFYWERVSAEPGLMANLGGKWIAGLIHSINPGFTFERTHVGAMTEDHIGTGGEKMTEGNGNDFVQRVNDALDQVRPMLAMDGGGIELVNADADRKTVSVRLMGACHGCAGAQMTLQHGVETALREKIPELEEMIVV